MNSSNSVVFATGGAQGIGTAADIGNAAVFLASPQASYIIGIVAANIECRSLELAGTSAAHIFLIAVKVKSATPDKGAALFNCAFTSREYSQAPCRH